MRSKNAQAIDLCDVCGEELSRRELLICDLCREELKNENIEVEEESA